MALTDPVVQGKVDILEVADKSIQAMVLLEQITALKGLESDFSFKNCAILSREWQDLDLIRSYLEKTGIPVSINWGRANFPALSRIREHADLLEYLEKHRTKEMRTSELAAQLRKKQAQKNIWQENLYGILDNWTEETGDSLQPVPAILDYLYETFNDQRRNGNMGNGIFLSTVHSVKGMEFDHVYILGENWQNKQGPELEEERRLYYVAMSRARKTLHLFSLQNNNNPHTSLLSRDAILRRTMTTEQNGELSPYRYATLGMKELYIDYAGSKTAKHPIHQSLRKLQTGDTLQIKKLKNSLYLLDHQGTALIRLAHNADKQWQPRLHTIREVCVLAMVKRQRKDIQDSTFAARCRVDTWELPVAELKYSNKITQVQSKKGH